MLYLVCGYVLLLPAAAATVPLPPPPLPNLWSLAMVELDGSTAQHATYFATVLLRAIAAICHHFYYYCYCLLALVRLSFPVMLTTMTITLMTMEREGGSLSLFLLRFGSVPLGAARDTPLDNFPLDIARLQSRALFVVSLCFRCLQLVTVWDPLPRCYSLLMLPLLLLAFLCLSKLNTSNFTLSTAVGHSIRRFAPSTK